MQARINSFILSSKSGIQVISLFGYSTKGLPGLELNGMGKLSQSLKEKIIYLTRERGLVLPRRRYVISLDLNDLSGKEVWTELKGLEFPSLLLYWYLGKILPIKKLDDCICQGYISASGRIYQNPIPKDVHKQLLEKMNESTLKEFKAIAPRLENNEYFQIDTNLLLNHIPQIKSSIIYQ